MSFVAKHWFLSSLLIALLVGYLATGPLAFLANHAWLKWLVVAFTMLIMSWPLELKTLIKAGTRPTAPLIATALNMIAAPLIAWPISYILGKELGSGLIVAAAAPSTLVSAAVWTRRAGGNDSVAIIVTIITNSLCFLVTPLWVFFLIGLEIPQSQLYSTITNLLVFVVLPMAIGQAIRIHPKSAIWATSHKPILSIVAQIGLLFVVLLGSIKMGQRLNETDSNIVGVNLLLLTIVVVGSIHLLVLKLGFVLGKRAGLDRTDQIAIGFSGSQKTLMVGLSTAISMGLNIIPIVAYHAVQLIVDTIIADHIKIPPATDTDQST